MSSASTTLEISAPSHLTRAPHVDTSFLEGPLFTPWTDPCSGVRSFLLNKRVAPVQQSFYFTSTSISDDGRYYWFYCAFPPGGSANQGRSLAVADLVESRVHHFPETVFTDASPLVDGKTGEAYWCTGLEIWKRKPDPEAKPEFVNRFPDELARNRRPWRLATHMTFSADRRAVNLDVEIGKEWLVGHAPLDGGDFVLWKKFDQCYNHAQFSPRDSGLQLIAQDYSIDPVTGCVVPYDNRMWLVRENGETEILYAEPLSGEARLRGANPHYTNDGPRAVHDERSMHGHEWWGTDGQHIWYVHYDHGVERTPVNSKTARTPEMIWPNKTICHAHTDTLERWLVGDSLPADESLTQTVQFYNRASGREIEIVSQLPRLPKKLACYHIHPHPQFCLGDRLICYTTTVRGYPDVAIVPVSDLLDATT